MSKVYGYCRVSTKHQSIDRQVANIKGVCDDAVFYCEAFTGTKMDRPEWNKLMKRVKAGDTIIFDAVDRMSRTAEEGVNQYMELYEKDVNLVFIKHPNINTAVYREAIAQAVPMTGGAIDCILKGINEYFKVLAKEQIRLAFDAAQAEVESNHKRTSEQMRVKHAGEKISAARTGKTYETKKAKEAKQEIRKYSKDFDGTNDDAACIKITGISRNTFYKYKRELKAAKD